MNLETFAAQIIKTTDRQNSNLLPVQQKTRSYSSLQEPVRKFEPNLIQYSIGEHRGEWVLRYNIQLDFITDRREVTKRQIQEFAENYLKVHSFANDDKYVVVSRADINQIWFQFDVVKWMNDNFKNTRPIFRPPMSLEFRYRNSIPSIIFIRSQLTALNKFIEGRFEDWLRLNTRRLHHKAFEFLRKITPQLFEYKLDTQGATLTAGLKYSVVIGALALYSAHHHNKQLSKEDLNRIKSTANRLGDVKRLDSLLKRF